MPDSMHFFFGCEGSGDIRQRNETRGKRIVAISPFLARTLNPEHRKERNGNDLDVLNFSAPEISRSKRAVRSFQSVDRL
jgi:hypothetical protein